MQFFLTIILLSTIWGFTQPQNTDDQNDPWFFWSVDWHPTQQQVVVGGMQDTLRLFSTQNFELLKNYPYKGTITKTKWHPSQNKLAISVQDGVSYSTILDLDNDQSITLDRVSPDGARAIGWNHNGDLLAVGDYDGYINLFDHEGTFIKRVNTGQKAIIGLDWHPDQDLLVAIGESIALYDPASDSLKHIEDRDEAVLMLCVAWHPDGTFFVTGDYGDFEYHYPPLLQYWTYHGERIQSITESEAEYRNLKWSSDGELLATASEKIRLWDRHGDLVAEKATTNLLWGVDWNTDASKLVATDGQGKIIFWDRQLNRITEVQY